MNRYYRVRREKQNIPDPKDLERVKFLMEQLSFKFLDSSTECHYVNGQLVKINRKERNE